MDNLIKIAVAAFVAYLFFLLLRAVVKGGSGGALFAIRLRNGEPSVASGKVIGAFVEEVRLAAASHGIKSGRVTGVDSGDRVRLEFSDDFPEPCRQRLRNVWVALGWGDRRKRGGGPGNGPRAKTY